MPSGAVPNSLLRHITPGDIAGASLWRQALGLHPPTMRLNQVGEQIVPDVDETMGREESLDVGRGAPAEKRQPLTETGILPASSGVLPRVDY